MDKITPPALTSVRLNFTKKMCQAESPTAKEKTLKIAAIHSQRNLPFSFFYILLLPLHPSAFLHFLGQQNW